MFEDYDEFDIALALYHWLQNNFQGQGDQLYEDFCKLTAEGMYRPAPTEEFFDNMDENAKAVYEILNESNYGEALKRVLEYKPTDY